MNIKNFQKEAYEIAREKGWHDKPRTPGELIALCHSELSEALEEVRNGGDYRFVATHPCSMSGFIDIKKSFDETRLSQFPTEKYISEGAQVKPEGFAIELADLIIRVADMAELYGIDLEEAIKIKMAYNRTRPYRHGGKAL